MQGMFSIPRWYSYSVCCYVALSLDTLGEDTHTELTTMRSPGTWLMVLSKLVLMVVSEQERRKLLGYLLDPSRYDSNIIPEFDEDYPTNVSLLIAITGMHSVSETAMEFSVDMALLQRWRDNRLDFSLNSSGVERLELDPKSIDGVWQPDMYFKNEKRATVHDVTTINKLMHIYPNGTVIYNMRLAVTFSCTMDLRNYPFDGQCCPIYVQSFAYTLDNINLNWWNPDGVTIGTLQMPQFELSTSVDLFDYNTTYITGTYSTLRADLKLRRKSGFYFLQVFVPSVLLVALSWVSFWVDAAAVPARVSLGVTCILTMTTQSSGTRQQLPPVSYVKAIDVWMFVCLLFVFAALLEFAYVNVLLRRPSYQTESTDDNGQTETTKSTRKDGHKLAMWVDKIARFAFPGAFAVFVIVFGLVCALTPGSSFATIDNCT